MSSRKHVRPAGLRRGEAGAGGFAAAWPEGSQDGPLARHIEFQYAGIAHQTETALSGMWLFLTTELLFFGGLFFLYMLLRAKQPHAVGVASQHAELVLGTVNTVLLLTSSAVFAWGLSCIRAGRNRALFVASVVTALLGTAFLVLKLYEWRADFDDHLFPGVHFAITGPDGNGAQLFWSFYFVATGLHLLHMVVGVGLVSWIALGARRARYSPGYHTPVEVVGLYWSFVDMVWLCLYPMIYLAGPIGT